ncbi:SMI1/KNR4 family protein [Rossellomorea vietnamensis]|uniref:SMI1/KNR4 family protein n=1 Tax=Rossellomorea vietnamensis TaxID=218284 RepID=UPI001E3E5EFE|nr:SMI1/KNR4 family protein [Rossellomorea vietnamensis]MCC5803750.1 SMI1/KNR4 family protein [Rossellomorea vietnamensis]
MEKIKQLLTQVRTLPHCRIFEPSGIPIIDEEKHILPNDLKEFYSLCGGLVLFENEEYPIYIVSPDKFVLANPIIVGELCEEDISSNWYIIGNDGTDDYLTIDLKEDRLGRCYDSFFDRHGLVGESQIIATSFTDLLERLIKNKGQYWYWLRSDFISLGDAYDDIE